MWCQRTFPVLPLSTQPVFQPGRIICCPTDLLFSFPVLTEPVCMLTFPPGISFPRLHPKKCNDTSKRGSVALRPVKSSCAVPAPATSLCSHCAFSYVTGVPDSRLLLDWWLCTMLSSHMCPLPLLVECLACRQPFPDTMEWPMMASFGTNTF